MENGPRLLGEERRRRIVGLVKSREAVTVEELAKHFGVSAVTIRADLDGLDRAGALLRSHGGALKRLDRDVPLDIKETLHRQEKVRIGKRAAEMVAPGETVILDSGTTTVEIARQIRKRDLQSLTVITNALNIAFELSSLPQIRVIMLGGILRPVSQSLVGPQAEQTLKDLNADRLFLGVDGLDLEVGLTTPDVVEAQLNLMMIRVSREVVVVADSSKFHRRSLSVIAKLDSVHEIVTDSRVAPGTVDALRARNIRVSVV